MNCLARTPGPCPDERPRAASFSHACSGAPDQRWPTRPFRVRQRGPSCTTCPRPISASLAIETRGRLPSVRTEGTMLWRNQAQTVRCVHSCPALHDNKVSRAVHRSAFESTFRTTSSVPICHYTHGQRSPDSAIVCTGRNPIDIISPEMG